MGGVGVSDGGYLFWGRGVSKGLSEDLTFLQKP